MPKKPPHRARPNRQRVIPPLTPAAPRHGKANASTSVAVRGGRQAEIDMSQAVVEALFGTPRRTPVRVIKQGEAMEPVVGSVLHFSPAAPGFLANLESEDGSSWQEPIIGWGCVVVWAAYSSDNEDVETKGTKQFQTELQPITLTEDGQLEPLVMREGLVLVGVGLPGMVALQPAHGTDRSP
jgi:hypothetical protein